VPTHRLRGRAFLETVRSASTAPVDFRGLAQNLAHAFMRRMELDPALVDRRPQLTPTASSCRQS
jgi:cell fate regulator YaaT (PSP1 superfamily)